jgi:hypothetical protein
VGMSRPDYQIDALERRMLLSLTPAGPEFRVNTFTTGHQRIPSIAMDAARLHAGRLRLQQHGEPGRLQPPRQSLRANGCAGDVDICFEVFGQSKDRGSDRVVW